MDRAKQEKILIIQPLPGIGDAVWFLPHLFSLRKVFPTALITLMTKKRSKADEVLKNQNIIDDYFWLEKNPGIHSGFFGFFRLVKTLKSKAYTAVWILHKSPRYALACKLAGIPKIYGYGNGYSKYIEVPPFLTKVQMTQHPIDLATALLTNHQVNLQGLEAITLKPNKEVTRMVCQKIDLTKNQKNIVLCIGGSESYKKWPDDYFKEIAHHFLKKNDKVYILGGPQEEREANLIAKEIKEETSFDVTVITSLSIPEVIGFLPQINLFIGNDTGMLNIAAATGIPSIGLFGQTPALSYRKNLHPIVAPVTNGDQRVSDILPDQVISLSNKFVD